jgi:glycosyltransferase 2 family protein
VTSRLRTAAVALGAGLSRNAIGLAISAAILAVSLYVLMRLLHGIDLARVAADVEAMPARDIAGALGFVGASYVTLTCYDLFALRSIGARHVPYRIAALTSFCSYAIGHNIGATVFSGGAIRYRIYAQFGLGVVDVAKICFLTGLTFWLGNITVLGWGMALFPEGPSNILVLPPDVVRIIGAVALLLLAAYVAWVSMAPRTLGRKGWSVGLPGGVSTLVQITIALADLGLSSLAMYSVMPTGEAYATVAVAFVASTLLGFASHTPGSLGVFDAAMLVALPWIGREELVAALVVFRLLYFMVPFALALATMACWEVALMFRKERKGG